MEIVGHEPNKTNLGYHYLDDSGKHQASILRFMGPDFSADRHVFAAAWEPGLIAWFVDGIQRYRVASKYVPSKPMHPIANLAVGGGTNNWVGAPDASTPFPSYYEVDYIRVWQR